MLVTFILNPCICLSPYVFYALMFCVPSRFVCPHVLCALKFIVVGAFVQVRILHSFYIAEVQYQLHHIFCF